MHAADRILNHFILCGPPRLPACYQPRPGRIVTPFVNTLNRSVRALRRSRGSGDECCRGGGEGGDEGPLTRSGPSVAAVPERHGHEIKRARRNVRGGLEKGARLGRRIVHSHSIADSGGCRKMVLRWAAPRNGTFGKAGRRIFNGLFGRNRERGVGLADPSHCSCKRRGRNGGEGSNGPGHFPGGGGSGFPRGVPD